MLNKAQVSLIPEPVKMTYDSKHFILEDDTIIVADLELERISEYLKKLIAPPTGFNTQVEIGIPSERQKQTIILQINKELNLGKEGYYLIVSHDNIHISAPKPVGIFYGVQSLRQLLPIEIEKRSLVNDLEWVVLGVKIEDYHQFSWRGFMLDEGRHFQGKDTIRRLLDILAFHKMNVFHWYLTEDQGWRIEIKEYPHLAEIGSIREGTQIGGMRSFLKKKKKVDDTPQYGYYTQDEIKEIISYANDRFIKVIPDELMEIFPSKIIHIGGDEVPKSRWKECPDCQERITTENRNNEEDLQTYFINRVASYSIDKGVIAICWNDILHDRLIPEIIGQHWLHGDEKLLDHLRKGRQFIISRFFYTYLDYPYTMTPLKKAYSFEPIPEKLEEEFRENVLGLEAPMWTEWVPSIDRLAWQVFPRLTAHAETGWTLQNNKNYTSFRKRLENFLNRLNLLGIKGARLEIADPNFLKRLLYPLDMLRDPQKNVTK